MIRYVYDAQGNYIGTHAHVKGQPIPARSTAIAPPEIGPGKYLVFSGRWYIKDAPIEPPEPRHEIPQSVSMRQARLALNQQGLLATIDSAVQGMATDAQIEWEYAQEIRRDHALVQSIKTSLGWTEAELDDLFILASSL